MSGAAPRIVKLEQTVPAVAIAADDSIAIGEAPFAGTVTSVTYTAEAAVTGHATETRTLSLVNKGQAGIGTTVIATLALLGTIDLVAYDEKVITLSATAANRVVVAGDELAWTSVHTGSTGLADPGGNLEIQISRT